MSPDVLKILAEKRPQFQLASGAKGLRSSEAFLYDAGGVNTAGLNRSSQALQDEGLRFLASQVASNATTIEVGGGASTVVFASRAKYHYCVNPDRTSNGLIVEFLDANGFDSSRVVFVSAPSDRGLPGLKIDGTIQLALLDGNHSFPFPMLDWHYIDPHLAVGGLLMVDNRSINTVRMLCDFLDRDSSYRFRIQLAECSVYEKVAQRVMGWGDQAINHHDYVGYAKLSAPYVQRRLKSAAKRALKR